MSKRPGENAEEDNERPNKRARISEEDSSAACLDVFPDKYSQCYNEQMFAFHRGTQLPAKITEGHIKASVVHILKYSGRKCVALILDLERADAGSASLGHLECELRNSKALNCQLPAHGDTVYVALTDARVLYNAEHNQLSFKLRFRTSLIYIVPNKGGGDRILKLMEDSDEAPTAAAPVPVQQLEESPEPRATTGSMPGHKTGTRRVRKQEVRVLGGREGSREGSSSASHKTARRENKSRNAASLDISTKVSRSVQISPPRVTPDAVGEDPILEKGQDKGQSDDKRQTPPAQNDEQPAAKEKETALVNVAKAKPEIPLIGFVSGNGVKFTNLQGLQGLPKNTRINIIAMVEQAMEPKRTQSGDFSRVLYLSDPSRPSPLFKTVLFQPRQEWLPDIHPGQILLVHNVHSDKFQNQYTATGRSGIFTWMAYDPPTRALFFANGEGGPKYQPLDRETMEYFGKLADWKAEVEKDPNRIVVAAPERKHKLISELETNRKYFNATVEVLGVEHRDWGLEVSVTDYTTNQLLEDRYATSQPLVGYKRTLRLEVWKKEARSYGMASVLKTGKYYRIKNFIFAQHKFAWTAKVSPRDDVEFEQLREDREDPDLRRLIERKQANVPGGTDEVETQNSEIPVLLGNPSNMNSTPDPNMEGTPVEAIEPVSGHRIVCETIEPQPYTSLRSIDQDSRNSVEYKVRVRVVGITPTDPRDIVRVECTQCHQIIDTTITDWALCPACKSTNSLEFDVKLVLRVMDEEKQHCSVIISGDDAKRFFGISPTCLRDNDMAHDGVIDDLVSKLRNIVGRLWRRGPRFEPSLEDETLPDVEMENGRMVEPNSPWIDLVLRSWLLRQSSDHHGSKWIRKYSLSGCFFQLE